jgi:hypothetical protein
MRPFPLFVLSACLSCAPHLTAQLSDVTSQTRALLDAYAHADTKTVLASVDDKTVIYGSDAAEIFEGTASIREMLSNDARLWSGTAHIGDMKNVTVVKQGHIESIFFQAPFTVGNRPPVPVRFCMIWRHNNNHWVLLQSSNAVVTEHQSAAELLGSH